MSAALLLTVAMAGSHDCCCPTYTSDYYAAPSSYGYTYSAPYGSPYYSAPSYNSAYRSPARSYAHSSGPQGHTAGYAPQPASQAAVVQMTDRARFEPAQISVNVGDTVEWRNASHHPHTVTANPELVKNPAHVVLPEGAKPFHSEEVAPGSQFSYKFTVPGTYFYVCLPHEDRGMVGIVVVKDPKAPEPKAPTPARGQGTGRTY